MVIQENIHQAKTHLSKLLSQVLKGDRVIIAKSGCPIAEIVPFIPSPQQRTPGSARGRITIADDFDAPLDGELLDGFES